MEYFSLSKNGQLIFDIRRSITSISSPRLSQVKTVLPPLPAKKSSFLKNKLFLISYVLTLTALIIPVVVLKAIKSRDEYTHNRLFDWKFAVVTLISTSGINLIASWALLFYLLYHRKDAAVSPEKVEGNHHRKLSVVGILTFLILTSCTLFFSFLLIIRSAAPECEKSSLYLIPDWTCNPYAAVPMFPMDTAFVLILVPSIFALMMKDQWIYLTFISWTITLSALIISCAISESKSGILIIFLYCVLSCVVFTDNARMHSHMNELYENLKTSLEQNQQLLDQQKMNQMKDMIGNVSHDLKTPLSSFMQGIDFLLDTLKEFEQKLPLILLKHDSFHQFFSEMKMHMKNIKNTNAFMLLTINRCIDFTKASKGLKLIPHLDTIDLLDTLTLPLNCMKNIQDRIKISLLPIDNQIYNYIVTDKQWLQENVLCLLSNAVKYSTGGEVTVSVTLHKELQKHTIHNHSVVSTERIGESKSESDLEKRDRSDERTFLQQSDVKTYILVEIEDTGIGLSKEKMDSLFSPFSQAQKLAGGTGLGLYSLSKRIESLEGKFGVKGRKDGKLGSLFWFTIPYRPDTSMITMLQPAKEVEYCESNNVIRLSSIDDQGFLSLHVDPDAPPPRNISDREYKNSPKANDPNYEKLIKKRMEKQRITSEFEDHHSQLPRRLSVTAQNLCFIDSSLTSSLHILLVEDSPTIAKMTSMLLKKMGFHVSTAENGHIGLNMMMSADEEKKKKYDLVLMDFQMPVMDGLEATRRYREYEKESQEKVHPVNHSHAHPHPLHQLIIGLSATCDKEIVEDAMKMGLDDYLMKPVSQDAILKIIKKFHLPYNSMI